MPFTRDIPTPLNIPNTVPRRDDNSQFAVTKITGDLDGNAASADDGIDEVQGLNGVTLVLSNKTLTASLDSATLGSLVIANNGSVVGQEPEINFIAGNNVTLTVVDDSINDRINVTIDAAGNITSASTIGSGTGPAVYKQTLGGVLQFRKINAASTKVAVAVDGTDGVGIDIVPGNIDHQDLADVGVLTHSEIDVILSDLSPTDAQSLDGQALTIYNTTTTLYSGYLTQGATAYESGLPAGSNVSYILNDATFTLQTPNTTSAINKGDTGTLDLYVNGSLVDSFDLASHFDETYRNTSQVYVPLSSTGGKITIMSVDKYNSFRAYQKVVARLNITPSMLVDGYNYIVLQHTMSTSQVSATYKIFYDTDAGANPAISGTPTLTGLSQTSSKYLSGIRYASTNDTIFLNCVGVNLFNNVYHNQPITYTGLVGVLNDVINFNDGAVSGVSAPPARGQTMTVASKTLTFTASSVCSKDGKITLTPRDPYGSYTAVASATLPLLISTFATTGNSNDRNEFFRDEQYRLPLTYDFTGFSGGVTGQWTSSNAISNGDAQVYFFNTTTHGLVYPTINFTSGYVPAQSRNYSTFTGNQQYVRAFVPTASKTSITVTLNGVAGGIGSLGTGDLNVEIKLPTQTGWLDGAVAFDSAAGVGSDGLGCLSGSISYTGGNAAFTLTFGGKATVDSGGRMYMRITLRNSNRSISSITTNW